jgi:hypothetical protein
MAAIGRFGRVWILPALRKLFIAVEPLGGWRHVEVTGTRMRVDFARFVKELVDGRYKYA